MQTRLLFAWQDHLPPETRTEAAQPLTADAALIVIVSTYTVNDCLSTGLGKVMVLKKKGQFAFVS